MTRLRAEDISDIPARLLEYDEELRQKTGSTLRQIACHAAGINEGMIIPTLASLRLGVVPIRSGQGILKGFCQAVQAILKHIGAVVFVTQESDAAGIAEAFEKGCCVVFLADDNRFVALNLEHRTVVDNCETTGKGFAAGLDLMTGGLKGQKVLVLGCGPVGCSATFALIRFGAKLAVHDIVCSRSLELAESSQSLLQKEIKVEEDFKQALLKYTLLIDATDSAHVIDEAAITPETYLAAPGMPLGLTAGALKKIGPRLLHDPLQIGVATMAIEAIKQSIIRK